MPRKFYSGTAEQVVAVVEGVVANGGKADLAFVASFTDLQEGQAMTSLGLATDMSLIRAEEDFYFVENPICNFLRTPQEKERAAVLRIVIEQYPPFTVFREELESSGDPNLAATRTKARLELDAHREDIKSTLLGLATYSGALVAGKAGKYIRDLKGAPNLIRELASGASEQGAALLQVRQQLAEYANSVSHDNVLLPLAAALRHAAAEAGREAVVHAGNAVETFLDEFAARNVVPFAGASGLNSKLDKIKLANKLPAKIVFNGKYLGHVRNAADHGRDAEIDDAWSITSQTGANFVFVAISFIVAVLNFEKQRFSL